MFDAELGRSREVAPGMRDTRHAGHAGSHLDWCMPSKRTLCARSGHCALHGRSDPPARNMLEDTAGGAQHNQASVELYLCVYARKGVLRKRHCQGSRVLISKNEFCN
jgi:hypothetical protein